MKGAGELRVTVERHGKRIEFQVELVNEDRRDGDGDGDDEPTGRGSGR
jgi:hypothetical protein